jgi:hypothetical protein
VYQSEIAPDTEPYDYKEYTVYSVDTDVTDIMAYATDTTRFGNRSGSGNQSSNCILNAEWIKIPEEQRQKILAERKQERLDNAMVVGHPSPHNAVPMPIVLNLTLTLTALLTMLLCMTKLNP